MHTGFWWRRLAKVGPVEVRRHRWEDNIKMDLKKMVWASMD
jgi:hypothetical protein